MASEDITAGADRRAQPELPSERRGGMRVARIGLAKVFDPALKRYYIARTEQVGSGGVRVELPGSALLRPGCAVEVYISADRGEPLVSKAHMRPARVVWVDRTARGAGGRMVVGLEYVAASAARMSAA